MFIIPIILIILWEIHIIGTLADEQLIDKNIFLWINISFSLEILLIILFIRYKAYYGLISFGVVSIITGLFSIYYDQLLLSSRGFWAFGMIVSIFLILGGVLLIWESRKNKQEKDI